MKRKQIHWAGVVNAAPGEIVAQHALSGAYHVFDPNKPVEPGIF